MDLKLNQRHVLITGASGGIGLEITKKFLTEKCTVTAHFNTQDTLLKELHNVYSKSLFTVQADLRNELEVKKLFSQSTKKFGKIDILIANAGVYPNEDKPIHTMTLEQWSNTLSEDITGPFLCVKYFLQNLQAFPGEYGSILLIGSTAGVFGESGHGDYAAAKAGLQGLMLSVKNEIIRIAPKGRINLVNPGWTVTPMAEDALSDKPRVKKILQTIPMRKVATVEDVANIVLFLSSDEVAGHITGQSLTIAGGMEGRILFEKEEIIL